MRYTTSQRFTTNTTWTAPAGVTRVIIVPDGGTGVVVAVVPNTSYAVTAATSPGALGSLFQYKYTAATGYFTLIWMDG